MKDVRTAAAVKIQKVFRGFLARKKYKIPQLKNAQLESYGTFAVGNDPIMPNLSEYKNNEEKIAIIGTSGLRSVELACKLGNKTHTPKIIIVDTSKEVYGFWYALRAFVANNDLANEKETFLKNLPQFLRCNSFLYRCLPDDIMQCVENDRIYLNQNIKAFLEKLFNKYDYHYVRNVIKNTSLMKQSWANMQIFASLKNILSLQGINKIYMYPSNIVECVDNKKVRQQILNNIFQTMPVMSIHTSLSWLYGVPGDIYVFSQNQDKVDVNLFRSNAYTRKMRMYVLPPATNTEEVEKVLTGAPKLN